MRIKNTCVASLLILSILIIPGIQGCEFKIVPQEQEKKEVEFVIVSEECIPEPVAILIESRKEKEMKLTYVDGKDRYLIIGYGKQNTGGYSISIKDLYATENVIYVDTCLMGPAKENKTKEVPSYPFIVLQIWEMGLPVVFQ